MYLPNSDQARVEKEKITEYMIREHERIVLTAEVPEEKLKPGDLGTVVHIYGQGEAYEVEIIALNGETLTVLTLPADKVRPIGRNEIPHARLLAG